MLRLAVLLIGLIAPPVRAGVLPDDPGAAAFVRANLIFGLYHEVGHALIDVLGLKDDREEDAADAFATLMIDRLWPEAEAEALVERSADAFLLYSQNSDAGAYLGQHSLDLQRYYTIVCLFYGAHPERRSAIAARLGLARERWKSCPGAYADAASSWADRLAGMPPQDHGPGLRLVVPRRRDPLTQLVGAELGRLNGEYGWPVWVDVTVEPCGEANLFYDPRARRIVVCTEYGDDLARLYGGTK